MRALALRDGKYFLIFLSPEAAGLVIPRESKILFHEANCPEGE